MAYVGRPLRRREDYPLLTGAGRFLDDITLPGLLHMAVVRSAHAHARINAVHTRAATETCGVVAAVTAADLGSPVPRVPAVIRFPGVAKVLHPLLADRIVRYVGEPVAAIVAEDRYVARDAAERVGIEYEVLPAVVSLDGALEPGAPVLFPELSSNCVFTHEVRAGDPEAAFGQAEVVVEATLEQPRLAAVTMECRGIVASYDAGEDRLVIWLSTQMPHAARAEIAAALGVPAERVRVIAPDVGGGFGAKGTRYADEILAAHLARRLRRPVKWIEDRQESFRTMTQGRGQRARVRAAVKRDGTVLAVDADILADLGAYCLGVTAVIPTLTIVVGLGAYRIPHARFRLRGVVTTQAPTGPYRGAGRPEGAYYIERLMDMIASRLGLDPAEVRRRNFIDRFPYKAATGLTHDSGNYPALLDRAMARVGYTRWREEQVRRRREGGRPIGIGLSTWVEIVGGAPGQLWEHGTVRLEPSGRVTVLTGSSSHGQGHETVFSQLAADALGIEPDQFTVRHGDTDVVPEGMGTFASRSLSIGGSAVVRAAGEVRRQVVEIAARLLEAAPGDLVLDQGRVSVRGTPGRSVTLAQVAHAAPAAAPGAPGGIAASLRFDAERHMVPSGAHIAVVELDPDTGAVSVLRYVAVDDCGTIVNPLIVDGQIHGALAQGLAQALLERVVYDEHGQLLTASLSDYAVPKADGLPKFESEMVPTPSPVNPLGARGIGEAGTIGAPPALVNAVLDALRPTGAVTVDLPVTPERLWRALSVGR
jgi:aerobic carbon-monoxide dehydrogenase large subunit